MGALVDPNYLGWILLLLQVIFRCFQNFENYRSSGSNYMPIVYGQKYNKFTDVGELISMLC